MSEDRLFQDEQLARRVLNRNGHDVVARMERAWSEFQACAESDYATTMNCCVTDLDQIHRECQSKRAQSASRFMQRWWEMHTWCEMKRLGMNVVTQKSGGRPDLEVMWDERRIWIECVASTPGNGQAVPQPKRNVPGAANESDYVPVPDIILRMTASIDAKVKGFAGYREKHVVGENDACVIALNSADISPDACLDREGDWVLRAVYGLVGQAAELPRRVASEPEFSTMTTIVKANESLVPAAAFSDGSAAEISGVLWSCASPYRCAAPVFIRNRTAKPLRRLSPTWLPSVACRWVDEAGEVVTAPAGTELSTSVKGCPRA